MKIVGFIWLEDIYKLSREALILSMESVLVESALSSSKVYFPVAKDLLSQVRTQARRQGVSAETLVNLWLQERLGAAA
jgi:hypothetical protein